MIHLLMGYNIIIQYYYYIPLITCITHVSGTNVTVIRGYRLFYGRRDSNTLGLFPKKSNNPLSLLPWLLPRPLPLSHITIVAVASDSDK